MIEREYYVFDSKKSFWHHLEEKIGFFNLIFIFSVIFHVGLYVFSILPSLLSPESVVEEYTTLKPEEMTVDIEEIEIPPKLIAKTPQTSSPAKVEKQDWVEGSSKDKSKDPPREKVNVNAVSGDGTDKDGYLFSFNGDKPPTPIVDFDLRDFFPSQAKAANITNKTVVLMVQIDENGKLQNVKIISKKVGYGFEEAAIKVIRLIEWSPGFVKGVPTKMAHQIPINFDLEQ